MAYAFVIIKGKIAWHEQSTGQIRRAKLKAARASHVRWRGAADPLANRPRSVSPAPLPRTNRVRGGIHSLLRITGLMPSNKGCGVMRNIAILGSPGRPAAWC